MSYAASESTVADQEKLRSANRYFAWQAEMTELHLGRRLFEIGCGLGVFTSQILGRQVGALAPNSRALHSLQTAQAEAQLTPLDSSIVPPVSSLETRLDPSFRQSRFAALEKTGTAD